MVDIKEIKDLVSIQIITVKLNGKTFVLSEKFVSLSARGKLKIVTFMKSTSAEKAFEKWEQDNYLMMTWLWNNMKSTVSANFIFLDTAKEIWEVVRDTYSIKKNASWVF